MKTNVKIKNTALCAVFASLNVVLLFFGTILDVFDLTVASVCSIVTIIVICETNIKYSLMMYIASSALALIFLPASTSTIFYISFFGYFPIILRYIAKLRKFLSVILSFLLFNAVMITDYVIFIKILGISGEGPWVYTLFLILSNVYFFAYRYVVTVFEIIYIKKLRKILKLK